MLVMLQVPVATQVACVVRLEIEQAPLWQVAWVVRLETEQLAVVHDDCVVRLETEHVPTAVHVLELL
jgi:hypothetical protein